MSRRCPECNQVLNKKKRCLCGWEETEMEIVRDWQCQFEGSRRCIMPAVSAISIHRNAKWYCSFHALELHDSKRCEEILDYVEENYEQILIDRIDWRVKLFEEDYRIAKTKILEHAAKILKKEKTNDYK